MFNISEFNDTTDNTGVAEMATEKFPTIGLKCLLQNSDLLDQLLNPSNPSPTVLSNKTTTSSTAGPTAILSTPVDAIIDVEKESSENNIILSTTTAETPAILPSDQVKDWSKEFELLSNNTTNNNTSINMDSLTKSADDSESFEHLLERLKTGKDVESSTNSSKQYGNAFLGQNLWDKHDLFQGDKLGVKFETVDFDDFFTENNLNEKEVEFLYKLQKKDSNNTNDTSSNTTTTTTNNNSNSTTDGGNSNVNTLSNYLNNNSNSNSNVLDQQQQQNGTKKDSVMTANDEETNLDMTFDDEMNDDEEDDLTPSEFRVSIGKKSKKQFVPDGMKDDRYWARRMKNNVAAKRSRDARRVKESQVAMRATLLERENDSLKRQLDDFRRESRVMKMKLARYEAFDLNSAIADNNTNK